MNLGGIVDWEEPRFIDRAKQARGWLRPTFDAMPGANLDSLGRLASLPGGDTEALFFFSSAGDSNGIIEPPTGRGGRFRATWSGAATVTLTGGTNITVINSNTIEFDCDWNGNKWLAFTPSAFPISVSIVRTDLLSAYAAGDVLDPSFLAFLPTGGCYRFMDWMVTNNSPVVNFSEYPTTAHQTWSRVPIDVMVDLCNTKNADPWFCMPHAATDAFVSSFADQVLAGLDSARKPRVELSNEIWNTGVFTQGAYFKAQAESVWGVANGYTNSAWLDYSAKRFCQIMALWSASWGASQSRLIGVLGGQAATTSVATSVLTAPLWRTYEPSEYVYPATIADEISIAPYINWVGSATTQGNTIKTALDVSQAAGVQAVKDMIPASLAQSKTWVDNHVAVAAERGCRLTMYEYNNHYDLNACSGSNLYSGGSPVAGALDTFVEATYSQEMADAQDELRTYWKSKAGSLAAFFVDVSRFSRFGTWGAATHINHDSAIWNALKAWRAANPRWWSQ